MVSQEHRKLIDNVELVRKEINERYADLRKLLGACTHEETEHNETFIEPCWQGGVFSGGFHAILRNLQTLSEDRRRH